MTKDKKDKFKIYVPVNKKQLAEHKRTWSKVAKDNNWYKKPFYIQVWADKDGNIIDSVAFKGMTEDIVILQDNIHCIKCGAEVSEAELYNGSFCPHCLFCLS
ncbi:MAG: hypothetical protein ACXACC_11005 [Promethearchaeota archaeon]